MLMPKRTKYRKQMRGRLKGNSNRGYEVSFGKYALKSLERGFISSKQLEAARKAISGATKRGGRLWIRVYPDKPITKKPLEVRMGGGKGAVDHYSVRVKPGRILFELSGLEKDIAEKAFKLASSKLSVLTTIIYEEE